ncbi:MAG: hypothetical protein IPL43_13445, partial [Micropruina sp.]|nr:hypothetical protein [Micropruina sp.]
ISEVSEWVADAAGGPEGAGPDVVAGGAAGEEPGALDLVGDAVAASPGELLDEAGEGFVEGHVVSVQVEVDGAAGAEAYVAGGEAGDAAEGLAVEDDERGGDPVVGGDGVVVDEALGGGPPAVTVGDVGPVLGCGRGRQLDASVEVVASACPGEEGSGLPVGGAGLGEPVVDVGLLGGVQGPAGPGEVV